MTFKWSKRPFIVGSIYGLIISILHINIDGFIKMPWSPIGVIGVAVAFYLGFKNNSSYDRTWEARKIWGSIVNNSRTFGAGVCSFLKDPRDEKIRKELIYRHIAWLTMLRTQLRLPKPWEHVEERAQIKHNLTAIEKDCEIMKESLHKYLSDAEFNEVNDKKNPAAQILKIQSKRLQELRDEGYYEDFRHMELFKLIQCFYADQGKSERIKTFPFPRQYASTALWLTFVFAAFVPFGLINVFNMGHWVEMVSVSFMSGLIIWIFFLMEKIGDYSENPFEGTYNDVPITAIANTIEIDLREMIGDDDIPEPTKDMNGFLM